MRVHVHEWGRTHGASVSVEMSGLGMRVWCSDIMKFMLCLLRWEKVKLKYKEKEKEKVLVGRGVG